MSNVAARRLLLICAALVIWGPPGLRARARGLDVALAGPTSGLDAAAALQVGAWLLALAVVSVLTIQHFERRTQLLSSVLGSNALRWYLLFGTIALLSAGYSVSRSYTIFFALKILVGALVLCLLVWHSPSRPANRPMNVLFVVFTLQAAVIAVLYVWSPDLVTPVGVTGRGRLTGGMFGDYGSSGLFAGLFFLTIALRTRRPGVLRASLLAYLGSWVLVVLSQTRSTMAAGVAFLVIMVHANRRARPWAGLIALAGGIALIGLSPGALQSIVGVATRHDQGLTTLSGRTLAFSYLMDRWREAPFLGRGYAAGTRSVLIDFVNTSHLSIGAGHDALSKVLVDLGLLGAVVLAIAFLASWSSLVRWWKATPNWHPEHLLVRQVTCLLVFVTIQLAVSESIAGSDLVFIVALVTMWAAAVNRRRDADRLPAPPRAMPAVLAGVHREMG